MYKEKYVNGTSAVKTERVHYDVYEENKLLKEKKKFKSNRKLKVKLFFGIITVFVMFAFITYRFSLITDLNYRVNKANIQYNNLKNENQILKVDIKSTTDLEKIKEIAESKLGMQMPDKAQVVYVNVPERDYTDVSSDYAKSSGNKSIIGYLSNKLGEISSLLN